MAGSDVIQILWLRPPSQRCKQSGARVRVARMLPGSVKLSRLLASACLAVRIKIQRLCLWHRPARRHACVLALLVLTAGSIVTWAQDSTPDPVATSSNADSEIIAVTADTLLESAAVEPPPPLVESFNPLAPVITTGPRGTLADFLQRIREIRAISMNTVSGYLQSDRLYPSSDESKAMLQAKVMAAIATRALEFEGVPSAIESFEYRGRVVLMLYDLIERVGPPSLTAVPDGAEMAARKETSWRMPGTEIVIRRVADGSRKGEWLFSEETIQRLPEWERWAVHLPVENREAENFLTIYKYGPLGLHETVPLRWMLALPAWAKVLLADQPVWRWIGLLLLLGGSTLVFTLLRRGIRRIQKSSRVGVSAALWADVAVPGVLALLIIFIRDVAA